MKKIFKIVASGENFVRFRNKLRPLLEHDQFSQKQVDEVLLAIQEVLTNILRHGYLGKPSGIKVIYADQPDQISITVEDSAKKFDPTKCAAPRLPRKTPGGLGIHLIRKSMDTVIYDESYKGGNRIHLIKFKQTPKNCDKNLEEVE